MADMIDTLFGPSPWQVQQAQQQALSKASAEHANRSLLQKASQGLFQGGGMLASGVAPAFGLVNPEIEKAKMNQAVMGAGGDLSTAQGLKMKAAQFAQIGDQATAMRLLMAARAMEKEEQAAILAANKDARQAAHELFVQNQQHELKLLTLQANRDRDKAASEDRRLSIEQREAASRRADATDRLIAQLRVDMKQQGGIGKPPAGYRYTPEGNLEAIPGGPKDMSGKNRAISETAEMKAKLVTQKVDEALKETGFFSTGLTGEVLGMIPGTSAYDLEATLDTIKANLGFNELQAMRQASPTGGALGQVAVRELEMLQATIASLKKGQSEPKLRSGLEQVKKHYGNWKKAVDAAAAQEGGQGAEMSNEDKKALSWANANPQDPRSAKIKARLGAN